MAIELRRVGWNDETTPSAVTLNVALVIVTVHVPSFDPKTRPGVPAKLHTPMSLEAYCVPRCVEVRSIVVPSRNCPTTLSCWLTLALTVVT